MDKRNCFKHSKEICYHGFQCYMWNPCCNSSEACYIVVSVCVRVKMSTDHTNTHTHTHTHLQIHTHTPGWHPQDNITTHCRCHTRKNLFSPTMDNPSELPDSKLVSPGRMLSEIKDILFSVERRALWSYESAFVSYFTDTFHLCNFNAADVQCMLKQKYIFLRCTVLFMRFESRSSFTSSYKLLYYNYYYTFYIFLYVL